jgi:hypothetical protein
MDLVPALKGYCRGTSTTPVEVDLGKTTYTRAAFFLLKVHQSTSPRIRVL